VNRAEPSLQLRWRTCAGDSWCRFDSVVLPDAAVSGILLVWSTVDEPVVYLGCGLRQRVQRDLKGAALGDLSQ